MIAEVKALQPFSGQQVVRTNGITVTPIGHAVNHLHLAGVHVNSSAELGLRCVSNIDEVEPSAITGDHGDGEVLIDGYIRAIARQLNLTEKDWLLELRGVDDGEAVGASR